MQITTEPQIRFEDGASYERMKHSEKIGMYGDTVEARIKGMAKLAEPFVHPTANYRFQQYMMFIKDDGPVTMLDLVDHPRESNAYP